MYAITISGWYGRHTQMKIHAGLAVHKAIVHFSLSFSTSRTYDYALPGSEDALGQLS